MNVKQFALAALTITGVSLFAVACGGSPTPAAQSNGSGATTIGAAPTVNSSTGASAQPTTASASSGAAATGARPAAAIPPEKRNDMYQAAPPMTIDLNKTYRATISTDKGDIVMDLYPKDAPQHVNNFVFLANQGFFDGLTFHRVEPGFVIQGGDPLGTGTGGPGYTIPPEIKRTHPKGAVAMARRGGPPETTPSSGSQFYITLDATPNLDGSYTSFGQVTPESLDIIEKIAKGDVIKSVTITEQ